MGGLVDLAGGIFIAALGGIMTDIGINLPPAAAQATTSAALINDRIADVLTAITSTITTNMLAWITNGDVTNWPSGAFKGRYGCLAL